MEGPENEPANEHVLNDAFSCSSFSFEVACRKSVRRIIFRCAILNQIKSFNVFALKQKLKSIITLSDELLTGML